MENSEVEKLKNELSQIKTVMNEIKVKVDNINSLEESEIKHILSVKDMESEELNNLTNLESLENEELNKLHKLAPKKFQDITSWKSMIWDSCKHKIMNSTQKIVTFKCDITNSICSFEKCPKNRLKEEDK